MYVCVCWKILIRIIVSWSKHNSSVTKIWVSAYRLRNADVNVKWNRYEGGIGGVEVYLHVFLTVTGMGWS